MLNFENLDKWQFDGVGKYNIPQIEPENVGISRHTEWIPYNYAMTEKQPEAKAVHCFVDDYQFCRLWNNADRYLQMLGKFICVCSPDFSTFTDMPIAMQIYNHYRKHWIGAYLQMNGIKVIPTISWSTPDSFDWCFDGEPTNSIVAVSSVGTQKNKEAKKLFDAGYNEMIRRLNPSEVIFYGKVPEEFDWNVIRVDPYYKRIEKARIEKHGR
jgi:hypothetical protein